MATLSLPLWFVSERKLSDGGSHILREDRSAPFVVTRNEPINRFLFEDQYRHWKIALVADRRELVAIVADLHELGISSVRINPAADGSGGEWVDLRELMAFCLPEPASP